MAGDRRLNSYYCSPMNSFHPPQPTASNRSIPSDPPYPPANSPSNSASHVIFGANPLPTAARPVLLTIFLFLFLSLFFFWFFDKMGIYVAGVAENISLVGGVAEVRDGWSRSSVGAG
jgi:hypothetical protein